MQEFGRILKILGTLSILVPLGLLLFLAALKHLLGVPPYYLFEVLVTVLLTLGLTLGILMIVLGFVITGIKSESKLGRRWFP